MTTLLYTAEWFRTHLPYRPEYHAMADVIHREFSVRSCIDLGCGIGLLIERLQELGWTVAGVDCEAAKGVAPESIRERIEVGDLTNPPLAGYLGHPLVICTEVAEHLASSQADILVASCAYRTATMGRIIFTAATPGQGGTGHVNEQPHAYWVSKFRARGLELDQAKTATLRGAFAEAAPNMAWMGKNVMVFA